MNSVGYFDIIIMVLFLIVSFSMFKTFKTEGVENFNPSNKNTDKLLSFKNNKNIEAIISDTISNESLDKKAEKLSKIDKSFSPQSFMSEMKKEFEAIFNSFNSKDISKIKNKVSAKVFSEFEKSISDLNSKKQAVIAEIIRFKSIIIKDINISKKKANIVIEFITEQTAAITDLKGKIIKGDDNQIEEVQDKWNFSKDYSIKNPSWILSDTIEV